MTARPVPDPLLSRFSQFVAGQMGLHFRPERASDLQRGIRSAAREFGFDEEQIALQPLRTALKFVQRANPPLKKTTAHLNWLVRGTPPGSESSGATEEARCLPNPPFSVSRLQ